jgi:hypothetical protein
VPQPVIMPLLDPGDVDTLRALTLREISQTITPGKVNDYVKTLFNGHHVLHVSELPADLFDDLPWFIYVVAYGNHPDVEYDIEPLPGEPVAAGPYRVKPFQLRGK